MRYDRVIIEPDGTNSRCSRDKSRDNYARGPGAPFHITTIWRSTTQTTVTSYTSESHQNHKEIQRQTKGARATGTPARDDGRATLYERKNVTMPVWRSPNAGDPRAYAAERSNAAK